MSSFTREQADVALREIIARHSAAQDTLSSEEILTAAEEVGVPRETAREALARWSLDEENRKAAAEARAKAWRRRWAWGASGGLLLACLGGALVSNANARVETEWNAVIQAKARLFEAHAYAHQVERDLPNVTDARDRGAMISGVQARLHVARLRYTEAALQYNTTRQSEWVGSRTLPLRAPDVATVERSRNGSP